MPPSEFEYHPHWDRWLVFMHPDGKRRLQTKNALSGVFSWCPQAGSNRCLGLERAPSWATRRWGRLAGVILSSARRIVNQIEFLAAYSSRLPKTIPQIALTKQNKWSMFEPEFQPCRPPSSYVFCFLSFHPSCTFV